MKDGSLVIYGPIIPNDGAIDYNGSFEYENGLIIAMGSTEMVECPSSTNQNVIMIKFAQKLMAESVIQIIDSANNVILSVNTTKYVQSLVFGSANLKKGDYSVSYTQGVQLENPYEFSGEPIEGRVLGTFTISDSITIYQIR